MAARCWARGPIYIGKVDVCRPITFTDNTIALAGRANRDLRFRAKLLRLRDQIEGNGHG